MNTRFAVLVLFLSSAGWGLTWLPIKALSNMGLDGMHLVFVAFFSGALLTLPWLYKQRGHWRQKCSLMLMVALAGGFPDNNAVLWVVAYGALWLTLIIAGTQWGVTQMEAGRSAVIIVIELVVAVVSTALIITGELTTFEIFGGLMVLSAALLEGSRNTDRQRDLEAAIH